MKSNNNETMNLVATWKTHIQKEGMTLQGLGVGLCPTCLNNSKGSVSNRKRLDYGFAGHLKAVEFYFARYRNIAKGHRSKSNISV